MEFQISFSSLFFFFQPRPPLTLDPLFFFFFHSSLSPRFLLHPGA